MLQQLIPTEDLRKTPITVTEVLAPAAPLVIAFPHSGDLYPADFQYRDGLSYGEIDYPADKYVDELFGAATDLGLSTIRANFPRAYIDVNRHQHDIDPGMLDAPDSWYGRIQPTGAQADGSGLFWSQAKHLPVYDRKLSLAEVKMRLATCFVPYHQALTSLIERTRRTFGTVCLLDCHSMMQFDPPARGNRPRPQIDIGTRHGHSCAPLFAETLAESFERRGYEVGINRRFVGGETTLRYGWPEIDQHALQIELRRDLYMDEESRAKSERFAQIQQDCTSALTELMQAVSSHARRADR